MGHYINVRLLSAVDDLRLANCLHVGRGKKYFIIIIFQNDYLMVSNLTFAYR